MKLTAAKRATLQHCAQPGGLTEPQRVVLGVQRRTLQQLNDAGLIRFRAYAKEPGWTITPDGAAALKVAL